MDHVLMQRCLSLIEPRKIIRAKTAGLYLGANIGQEGARIVGGGEGCLNR